MEKQYGCLPCRLIGEGDSYDGVSCPKCGEKMYPMRNEQQEQKKASPAEIEWKMEYLRELRQIQSPRPEDIKQMNDRINKVCDSIDNDLGIGKLSIGDLTVNLKVGIDMSVIEDHSSIEKLKIIVDDKGIVSVFMNGKEVTGKKSVKFEWVIGNAATHIIEYLSCTARHGE